MLHYTLPSAISHFFYMTWQMVKSLKRYCKRVGRKGIDVYVFFFPLQKKPQGVYT